MRRAAALLIALAAAGCGGDEPPAPAAEAPAPPPPLGRRDGDSLIVIVLDTLRPDHMSLYGHDRPTTPFLEELARESLVFERAYVPASWTRASTASLLTSRLPESHGAEGRDGVLAPSVTTLAEALSEAGHDTRAVVANGNVIDRWGFDQGFDEFRFVKDFPRRPYADADVMEPVVHAVADRLDEDPFFLYLHYVDPHDPYYVHEGYDFTDPEYDGPIDGARDSLKPFNAKRPSDADVAHVEALYDGEIAWLDAKLRDLFARFAADGLLARAWVVVTSDHGEGLWRHRTRAHGNEVYDEQLRVPLLVRPPGGMAAGARVAEPISIVDVAPTLLDLIGAPAPADFEGRSWAGYLSGEGEAPVRPIIVDEQLDAFDMGAVIDGDQKLIVDFGRRTFELYDLRADPDEQDGHRAPRVSGLPAPARRLELILRRAITEAKGRRPTEGTTRDDPMDPELRAQLEGMGYLEGADDDDG